MVVKSISVGGPDDELVLSFLSILVHGYCFAWMCYMTYTATKLHIIKKKIMTALNVTQMVIMSARAVLILVFAISPGLQNFCEVRRWGGLISSQLLPPIAWIIMFVRMFNLFKTKRYVLYVVGFFLVAAFGCTFPQTLLYGYKTDKWERCTLIVNPFGKMLFFSVDVFMQVLECSLFVYVIFTSKSRVNNQVAQRLAFLVNCSLRAAFIDCGFTIIGLAFTIANVPSPYALFVFHIVDYGKIYASWLFVIDSMFIPQDEGLESTPLSKLSLFKKSGNSRTSEDKSQYSGAQTSDIQLQSKPDFILDDSVAWKGHDRSGAMHNSPATVTNTSPNSYGMSPTSHGPQYSARYAGSTYELNSNFNNMSQPQVWYDPNANKFGPAATKPKDNYIPW